MELLIGIDGRIGCLYDEALDLARLGSLTIRRASWVEPDAVGQWWANLEPVHGPLLGPFTQRSQALRAEREWLERNLPSLPLWTLPE